MVFTYPIRALPPGSITKKTLKPPYLVIVDAFLGTLYQLVLLANYTSLNLLVLEDRRPIESEVLFKLNIVVSS